MPMHTLTMPYPAELPATIGVTPEAFERELRCPQYLPLEDNAVDLRNSIMRGSLRYLRLENLKTQDF